MLRASTGVEREVRPAHAGPRSIRARRCRVRRLSVAPTSGQGNNVRISLTQVRRRWLGWTSLVRPHGPRSGLTCLGAWGTVLRARRNGEREIPNRGRGIDRAARPVYINPCAPSEAQHLDKRIAWNHERRRLNLSGLPSMVLHGTTEPKKVHTLPRHEGAYGRKDMMESLILAQDKRWRRA